jgi:hypothetical protein
VLNGGGATRFNEISDCVTHIIVGDVVSSDLKVLKSGGFRYDFLHAHCFNIYVLDSLYLFLLFYIMNYFSTDRMEIESKIYV